MRAQHQPLDRNTPRQPLFTRCFLATPFAFAVSMVTILGRLGSNSTDIIARSLAVMTVLWFCRAETRWFGRQMYLGLGQALLSGVKSVALALAAALGVAVAMTLRL